MIWHMLLFVEKPVWAQEVTTRANSSIRADRLEQAFLPRAPALRRREAITFDPVQVNASQRVRLRQRNTFVAFGPFEWSAQALRRHTDALSTSGADNVRSSRSWSIATETAWVYGDRNRLFVAASYATDRQSTETAAARNLHAITTTSVAEFGWDHGRDVRLTVGYRSVGGRMPVDPNVRAIDLAYGAALHEHGIQTTATTRLGGLWRGSDMMVGAKLTAAIVPTDEYLSSVAHDRSDHRITLLLQSRF